MKALQSEGKWADASSVPTMRELTVDELFLVGGGDDAGCTPGDSGADGGACAAQGDSSSSIGSLPEITVSAAAENGIGDAEAEQLVQNIDSAMTNPVIALAYFSQRSQTS